jgi:hypothetical protein
VALQAQAHVLREEALHAEPEAGGEAGVVAERAVAGGVARGSGQERTEELDAALALLLLETDHQALDLYVE